MPSTASARNVLVVLGHPSSTSLSAALAQAYADGARAAGHQVRMLRLGELAFDPVLHGSNPHLQPLEADLRAAQEDMQWAQHMAWVFPVWWGSVPALLKGFLDRAFTSGYAYKFQPGASFPTPLLRGRTADLLVPLDTPPWYYRWIYRMPAVHQMRKTTLDFCGIRTRRTRLWGPVIHSHAPQRAQWLEEAQALGRSV
ncbi:NAD(P)H-dependent oxidoreductase [Curvibacter sp. APW13]|uniref:NAD(P)H-dependent oxidoreductase n=1 Tax=Curvibacter sp. APW13 TaxID=3077236 RepID=UPI0028E07F09|nr:NAD(P)H-dependent oxidoreductase [Curvibacter sp. APW13]MDT8991976.1 NAD(P)H-dependent oxidoreductase [Curvibacter sp. APW13]